MKETSIPGAEKHSEFVLEIPFAKRPDHSLDIAKLVGSSTLMTPIII